MYVNPPVAGAPPLIDVQVYCKPPFSPCEPDVPLDPDVPDIPLDPEVPDDPEEPDDPDVPFPPAAPSRLVVHDEYVPVPSISVTLSVSAPLPEL